MTKRVHEINHYHELYFGTDEQMSNEKKMDMRLAIYSVAVDQFIVPGRCDLPLVTVLHESYFHRYTTYVLFKKDNFLRRQNHVDVQLYGNKTRSQSRPGMYPVAIMVVQHGNMFSSSWKEIASQHGKSRKKEVVNYYKKYALVHMIATKSGMEGKCCAQT